jgi:hypothetical protein
LGADFEGSSEDVVVAKGQLVPVVIEEVVVAFGCTVVEEFVVDTVLGVVVVDLFEVVVEFAVVVELEGLEPSKMILS